MPPSGRRDALPRRPATASTAATSSSPSLQSKNEGTEKSLVSPTDAESSENTKKSLVGDGTKGREAGLAETFMIDGFVIEAYTCMADVPFAECIPVPTRKSCANERADSLYGFCRTCLTNKPGPMMLCEQCDRAFHLTCLHPPLHEAPRGEWECARCVRQHRFHNHLRATNAQSAVRAANAIAAPVPPPRLRHKHLAVTSQLPLPMSHSLPSPPAQHAPSCRPPRKRARMHLQSQHLLSTEPVYFPKETSSLASTMDTVRAVRAAIEVARSNGMSVDDARLNAAAEAVRLLSTATVRQAALGVEAREVRVGAEVTSCPIMNPPQSPYPLPPSLPDRLSKPASPIKPRRGPGRPKGSLNKVRKARIGVSLPALGNIPVASVLPNGEGPPRPKRPRGRPPKAASLAAISAAITIPTAATDAPRRGPGRPPKEPNSGSVMSSGSTAPFPARRGRPPKAPTPINAAPARGLCRPSKTITNAVSRGPERLSTAEAGPSRGPGRPPKGKPSNILQSLSQSQLHSTEGASPATSTVIKAPRGRPPKSPTERPLIKAPRGRPPKSRILQQHRKDQETMEQQFPQDREQQSSSQQGSKENESMDAHRLDDANLQVGFQKPQRASPQLRVQSEGLPFTSSQQEVDVKQTQSSLNPPLEQLQQTHLDLPSKSPGSHPNQIQYRYQQQKQRGAIVEAVQQHQQHVLQHNQVVNRSQIFKGKEAHFAQPYGRSHVQQQSTQAWQSPLSAPDDARLLQEGKNPDLKLSTVEQGGARQLQLVKSEIQNVGVPDRIRHTTTPLNSNTTKPESLFHPTHIPAQSMAPHYQDYGQSRLISNPDATPKLDPKLSGLTGFHSDIKSLKPKAQSEQLSSIQYQQMQSDHFKQNSSIAPRADPKWHTLKLQSQQVALMPTLPHHHPSPFTSKAQLHHHSLSGLAPPYPIKDLSRNQQQLSQAYHQQSHPVHNLQNATENQPLPQYRLQPQNHIHQQQRFQSLQVYHPQNHQTLFSSQQLRYQQPVSCPGRQDSQHQHLTQQQPFLQREQIKYGQHPHFLQNTETKQQIGMFSAQFEDQYHVQRQRQNIPKSTQAVVTNPHSMLRSVTTSKTATCSSFSVSPKARTPEVPSEHQQSPSVSHLLNTHGRSVSQNVDYSTVASESARPLQAPCSTPVSERSRTNNVTSQRHPYAVSHFGTQHDIVVRPRSGSMSKSLPSSDSDLQAPQNLAARISRLPIQEAMPRQVRPQTQEGQSIVDRSITTAQPSKPNTNLLNRLANCPPANFSANNAGRNSANVKINSQLLPQTETNIASSSARTGSMEEKSQSYMESEAKRSNYVSTVIDDNGASINGTAVGHDANLSKSFSNSNVLSKEQQEAPYSPSALGDDVPLSQLFKHRQIAQKHDSKNARGSNGTLSISHSANKAIVHQDKQLVSGLGSRKAHSSDSQGAPARLNRTLGSAMPHSSEVNRTDGSGTITRSFLQNTDSQVRGQEQEVQDSKLRMSNSSMIPPVSRAQLGASAVVAPSAPIMTNNSVINFRQPTPRIDIGSREHLGNQSAQRSPDVNFIAHSKDRFSHGVNRTNGQLSAPIPANSATSHSSQVVSYSPTQQIETPPRAVKASTSFAQPVAQHQIAPKEGFYSRNGGPPARYAPIAQQATHLTHIPDKQEHVSHIQARPHDIQSQAQPYQLQLQSNAGYIGQQQGNLHSPQQLVAGRIDLPQIPSSQAMLPLHTRQMQINTIHQAPNQQMTTEIGVHPMTPQQLAQAQLAQAQMAKKRRTPEQLAQAQLAHSHLTQAQIAKKRRTPQQLAQSQFVQARHLQVAVQVQGDQSRHSHHPLNTAIQPQHTTTVPQNCIYQAQIPYVKPGEERADSGITLRTHPESAQAAASHQAPVTRSPHGVYVQSSQAQVDQPQSYHPMDTRLQPTFTPSLVDPVPLTQSAYARTSFEQLTHPGQVAVNQSNGPQAGQGTQTLQMAAPTPAVAPAAVSAPAASVLGVRPLR